MTPQEIKEAQEANRQAAADKIKAICEEHGINIIPVTRIGFENGQWQDMSAVVIVDVVPEATNTAPPMPPTDPPTS